MEVRDKVLRLLEDAVQHSGGGAVELGLETPIAELGLDSLKLIEVIYELERGFSIEVGEELLSQLECVGDIVSVVDSALRGAAA